MRLPEPPGAEIPLHLGSGVREGLDKVEILLRDTVLTEDSLLSDLSLYLLSLGGKRLRPVVVLLASGDAPYSECVLRAAAAVELLHLASLYHDDVMDRAASRRGGQAANAVWGNELAVLAGSHLFARAVQLLATLGEGHIQVGSQAASRLCVGQLREALCAYDVEVTVAERLEIVELKTATLFELAARLGAQLVRRSPREKEALIEYGRHVGLAFQLADDGLDFTGDQRTIGKNVGNDLREGVYSLPLVRILNRSDGMGNRCREVLTRFQITPGEVEEVFNLIRTSGATNEVKALASKHAKKAKDTLKKLGSGPSRASLEVLADYAVERSA